METTINHEERLIDLESKIAYLENYVNELNAVVIEQEKSMARLASETENMKKQIAAGKEALPENEKPPHY